MSKKCVAFSKSKLGLEKPDNRKSFYAGWEAAIREALAEQQDKPEECAYGCPEKTVCDYCQRAEPVRRPQNCGTGYCSCIECPYEPVKQEPVGVVEPSEEWGVAGVLIAGLPIGTKLYAAPVQPVKQEPVAKNEGGRITWLVDSWPQNCLLYSEPVQTVKSEPIGWLMTNGVFTENEFEAKMDGPDAIPVYANPVDFMTDKAIRAEALEEAAKWLAESGLIGSNDCAAAIRGLK